jgi:hypothetical protein
VDVHRGVAFGRQRSFEVGCCTGGSSRAAPCVVAGLDAEREGEPCVLQGPPEESGVVVVRAGREYREPGSVSVSTEAVGAGLDAGREGEPRVL